MLWVYDCGLFVYTFFHVGVAAAQLFVGFLCISTEKSCRRSKMGGMQEAYFSDIFHPFCATAPEERCHVECRGLFLRPGPGLSGQDSQARNLQKAPSSGAFKPWPIAKLTLAYLELREAVLSVFFMLLPFLPPTPSCLPCTSRIGSGFLPNNNKNTLHWDEKGISFLSYQSSTNLKLQPWGYVYLIYYTSYQWNMTFQLMRTYLVTVLTFAYDSLTQE